MRIQFKKGFSLVELASSLIIIGLLLAGVSSGSILLKQAKLRSIIMDFKELKTNYLTFTERFNRVPGDMENAFSFWDTECGEIEAVCIGNSNGIVDGVDASSDDEVAKAWRHMKLADLYKGPSEAILSSYTGQIIVGENAPNSKIDQVGYFISGNTLNANSTTLNSPWTDGKTNAVFIGKNSATSSPTVGAISSKDAYYLDSKFDDGRIDNSGSLIGHSSGKLRFLNDETTSTGCINSGSYNMDDETAACLGGYELH